MLPVELLGAVPGLSVEIHSFYPQIPAGPVPELPENPVPERGVLRHSLDGCVVPEERYLGEASREGFDEFDILIE
jgi:hypothetical protein